MSLRLIAAPVAQTESSRRGCVPRSPQPLDKTARLKYVKRSAFQHSKMRRLMHQFDLRGYAAVGILESLWNLCARETPQGNIGKLSDAAIADAIDWPGSPTDLIEGLIQSGWLDKSQEYRLLIHDWHDHADEAVKKSLQRSNLLFLSRHVETCSPHSLDMSLPPEPCLACALPKPGPPGPEPPMAEPSPSVGAHGEYRAKKSNTSTPASNLSTDVRDIPIKSTKGEEELEGDIEAELQTPSPIERPPSLSERMDASENTHELCGDLGIFILRDEADMHACLAKYMKSSGKPVKAASAYMVAKWKEYQATPGLEWRYGSSYKFFMSGNWDKPETWPLAKNGRKESERDRKRREFMEAPTDDGS